MRALINSAGPVIQYLWVALLVSVGAALIFGRFALAFVSFATLALSVAQVMLASRLSVRLPMPFLLSTTAFVFASLVLGEALDFYNRLWWWDLALHGSAAVGFGLFGFLFVFMLFEGDRFAAPPAAIAFITFCVAMMIGALWEVFEFGMDQLFGLNMQKSGLMDTMGDLILNALGGFLASLAGYFYLRYKAAGPIGRSIDEFIKLNRKYYGKARDRFKR